MRIMPPSLANDKRSLRVNATTPAVNSRNSSPNEAACLSDVERRAYLKSCRVVFVDECLVSPVDRLFGVRHIVFSPSVDTTVDGVVFRVLQPATLTSPIGSRRSWLTTLLFLVYLLLGIPSSKRQSVEPPAFLHSPVRLICVSRSSSYTIYLHTLAGRKLLFWQVKEILSGLMLLCCAVQLSGRHSPRPWLSLPPDVVSGGAIHRVIMYHLARAWSASRSPPPCPCPWSASRASSGSWWGLSISREMRVHGGDDGGGQFGRRRPDILPSRG